jgi:hypothetical protein
MRTIDEDTWTEPVPRYSRVVCSGLSGCRLAAERGRANCEARK